MLQTSIVTKRLQAWTQRLPALRNWLTISSPQGMLPEAVPFQTDLEELIQEPPPRYMRMTLYLLVLLFISIMLIASLAKVDIVVQGQGRLATVVPPMILQPLDRSIIREIKVHPGEGVKKGQVLALLDPTFAQADLASLQVQHQSMAAQVRRIEAELSGRPFEVAKDANSDEAIQASLYRQHQAQYKSRLRSFDEDIQHDEAGMRTTQDDVVSLRKQLSISIDSENMRANLMESHTGTKLQYLDAQSMRMRSERDLQDAVNRLTELSHTLQSLRAQKETFIEDWHRQLSDELVKSRPELSRLNEALTKANRMHDLVVLTAPEDGVVLEVAKRSEGSVTKDNEPVVTLVPISTPMVAEIVISSNEIGYVKAGDRVVIKVDAFPYQRHGLLRGELQSISEESYGSAQQADPSLFSEHSAIGAVHKARIELDEGVVLHNLPDGIHLIPGMTLTADIQVGTRSILSYFMYPMTRGLSESVSEP